MLRPLVLFPHYTPELKILWGRKCLGTLAKRPADADIRDNSLEKQRPCRKKKTGGKKSQPCINILKDRGECFILWNKNTDAMLKKEHSET